MLSLLILPLERDHFLESYLFKDLVLMIRMKPRDLFTRVVLNQLLLNGR